MSVRSILEWTAGLLILALVVTVVVADWVLMLKGQQGPLWFRILDEALKSLIIVGALIYLAILLWKKGL